MIIMWIVEKVASMTGKVVDKFTGYNSQNEAELDAKMLNEDSDGAPISYGEDSDFIYKVKKGKGGVS